MRIIIICLIVLLQNSISYGCDCDNQRTFCETMELQITEGEYIVKAIKLTDINHGMDVEIINSYREEFPKDTIRVWGDNGALCRVGTGLFEDGDTLIMKLYLLDTMFSEHFHEGELPGDFELSFCGQYYLEVKNNKVIGRISPETEEMGIDAFDELMKKETVFEECITSNTTKQELQQEVSLYPNPVEGELNIASNHRISDIKIYDVLGQTIYKISNIDNDRFKINISNFKEGLYFIEIASGENKSIVKKILKQ